MEVKELYVFALTIVMVGMLVGVGVLALDTFGNSSADVWNYSTAGVALNNGRDAVAAVANTWLGLVITIAVLAIIMALVVRGFSGR